MYEMKDYRPAVASARRVIDTYPARGRGHPPLGVGRRRARLVRARRVPAGGAGVQPGAGGHAGGRRVAGRRSSTTSPPRSTSRAKRQTQARGLSRRRRPLPADPRGCALVRHPRVGRVRRRRRPDPPAGLDGGGERARRVPHHLPEARAYGSRPTSRLPTPTGRAASCRCAAAEYDRIAARSDDPALRREALLAAGDLYEQSKAGDRALDCYIRYVKEFPKPVETALETRFKIAEVYKASNDESALSQGAQGNRPHRRESRVGTDRPHADDCRHVRRWSSRSSSFADSSPSSCDSRSRPA